MICITLYTITRKASLKFSRITHIWNSPRSETQLGNMAFVLRGYLKEIIKIVPHIQGIRNDLWGQRRKESMMATGIHFYTKQNDLKMKYLLSTTISKSSSSSSSMDFI